MASPIACYLKKNLVIEAATSLGLMVGSDPSLVHGYVSFERVFLFYISDIMSQLFLPVKLST